MSYLNRVELLGNVGSTPEVLETKTNGGKSKKFVKISLATNLNYLDAKGGKHVKTAWHTIYFNDRLAAVAENYLQKGSRIYVAGRLDYKEWENKKSGEKHLSAFVLASQLIFADGKAKANNTQSEFEVPSEEADRYDDVPY